jgi:hypothetical protein
MICFYNQKVGGLFDLANDNAYNMRFVAMLADGRTIGF